MTGICHCCTDDRRYVRSKARGLDSSQLEQGNRQKQIAYDQAHVEKKHVGDAARQQKKDAHEEMMNNLVVVLNVEEIHEKNLNVAAIDAQLDWHRTWGSEASLIPVKSKCGVKLSRLEILRAAVTRFNESGRKLEDCTRVSAGSVGAGDVAMAVEHSGPNRGDDTDTDME